MRIAAIADLHYTRTTGQDLGPLLSDASRSADVLLLCGDLTDYGLPEEAQLLAAELRRQVNIPVLGVLGNHDFESGNVAEVHRILCEQGGMHLLDGDAIELDGVGFAGVKGFGGGFGKRMLSPWGEPAIKNFVEEAVSEQLKLESALSRVRSERRVVLLHYAPVEATVVGEPEPLWPFLGCSRLERALDRSPVNAVFHGHAHHGSPTGETTTGIPVFNVSVKVLRKAYPERPPFLLHEV